MPSAQLPRVGSPRSESMLIPFLQVEARLLALLAPSILCKEFWLDTDIHLVVRLPTFPACPAARAFMSVTLDQHYGRNIFRFFCRAASRSSVFFFWRSISFCGSSCPSSFMDLAIAASTCAFSRFENIASAKEFRNLERTRFIEYCESSQRAMTFSVDLYSSLVGKLISPAGLVAVPYFVEMACTMSSAVSPCVASRS